jgi:hypothetical protein
MRLYRWREEAPSGKEPPMTTYHVTFHGSGGPLKKRVEAASKTKAMLEAFEFFYEKGHNMLAVTGHEVKEEKG